MTAIRVDLAIQVGTHLKRSQVVVVFRCVAQGVFLIPILFSASVDHASPSHGWGVGGLVLRRKRVVSVEALLADALVQGINQRTAVDQSQRWQRAVQ
ncbi:hypothetical protein D3C87_1476310 [compost metagenome]